MATHFKKRFFGKWVLAGEYSVLRMGSALVYPLKHYYIDFNYKDTTKSLKIKRKGQQKAGLDFAVTPLLQNALKTLNKQRTDLTGSLIIEGNLPFGSGLGASSALCVGMSWLFLYKKWIKKHQIKTFSTALEDFFHGKSSGMDVTAVLEEAPILYQNPNVFKKLNPFKNKPLLFLSYSGGRSSTSVGVSKVRGLFDKDWPLAEQIDKQMNQSVEICLQALKETNKTESLLKLARAINLGHNCFEKWKLISYDLEQHIIYLKQKGAIAVKPTGSGLGGHVISLWNKKPPSSLNKKLIPLNI